MSIRTSIIGMTLCITALIVILIRTAPQPVPHSDENSMPCVYILRVGNTSSLASPIETQLIRLRGVPNDSLAVLSIGHNVIAIGVLSNAKQRRGWNRFVDGYGGIPNKEGE